MQLGQKSGRPGRVQPSMNVTPLVDVVLVLLIIFMVITPLLAKQFWLSLPNKVEKAEPPSSDQDASIVVSIAKTGEIRINRDVVTREAFQPKLRRVLSGSQQRTVFFDADEDVAFELAVDTLDLARAAGAANIAVLTEPLAAP